MELFIDQSAHLVGYLVPDTSDTGQWREILDTKVPLRLRSSKSGWSVAVHQDDGLPYFSLCLGFNKPDGSVIMKPLKSLCVLEIHVRLDHIFIDVVNAETGVLGCIILRPQEDHIFDRKPMCKSVNNLKNPFNQCLDDFITKHLNNEDYLSKIRKLGDFISRGFLAAAARKRVQEGFTGRHEHGRDMGTDPPSQGSTPASRGGTAPTRASKGKEVVPPSTSGAAQRQSSQRRENAGRLPSITPTSTAAPMATGRPEGGESRGRSNAPTSSPADPAGRRTSTGSIQSGPRTATMAAASTPTSTTRRESSQTTETSSIPRDAAPATQSSGQPSTPNTEPRRSRAPAQSVLPGARTMPPRRNVDRSSEEMVVNLADTEEQPRSQQRPPVSAQPAARPTSRNKLLTSKKAGRKRKKDDMDGRSAEAGASEQREPSPPRTGPIPRELTAQVDEATASQNAVQKTVFGTWATGGQWSKYPDVKPFDASMVPEHLSVKAATKKKSTDKSDILRVHEELEGHVEANLKFKENAAYMYIFGQGSYFQLGLEDMEPSDAKSGRIYRPLEDEGVAKVLKSMVKINFNKQILTVMPNTKERPKNWRECVAAGKFKIINGQHTWEAARQIVEGEVYVKDASMKDRLRIWTCEIVWSSNANHLHTLSYKCNDGNDEQPYLTSTPGLVQHLREKWCNLGRPKMRRKNTKFPKGSADEEERLRFEVCPACNMRII